MSKVFEIFSDQQLGEAEGGRGQGKVRAIRLAHPPTLSEAVISQLF